MVAEHKVRSTEPATLPRWPRVLAVVAHPDDESFGLGAVLSAFVSAGSRVGVLCLTEGESAVAGEGPHRGRVRREELAAAAAELGVEATVLHHPDGDLASVERHILAGEVVDAAGSVHPVGLLTFDEGGITGDPDHQAATAAALLAAGILDLPVLAWTLPAAVAARLDQAAGDTVFRGRPDQDVDLVVPVDRTRQLAASQVYLDRSAPTGQLWRRLELLGDNEHLRWLRRAR